MPAQAPLERRRNHPEVVIDRVFDAPRELVFSAWSEAEHVARWFGPHGFTNVACEMDFRPGGALYLVMRAPDGTEHPMHGTFREIEAPRHLIFTNVLQNAQGRIDLEVVVTVTFDDHPRGTLLHLHAQVVTATEAAMVYLQGMEAGWNQLVERLAGYVKEMA